MFLKRTQNSAKSTNSQALNLVTYDAELWALNSDCYRFCCRAESGTKAAFGGARCQTVNEILNPKPETLNPKPSTLNPKP